VLEAEHVKIDRQTMRRAALPPRAAGESGSLFGASPLPGSPKRRKPAPELIAARALCHQLKRKRVSAEKKRLVHLICLNLLSILRRRSHQI
jgi:hypothetical protein